MDAKDKEDNSTVANETDIFSQIEHMSLEEFRKYLREKGYLNLYDLLTIPIYSFSRGKGSIILQNTKEIELLKEIIFAYKYELTKDHIETLKLMAKGYKYHEIADKLKIVISPDGVNKRVRTIFKKLGVHSRHEAVNKATKEGLI
jgi:DNA-binding CsgD family transcriptional regulator